MKTQNNKGTIYINLSERGWDYKPNNGFHITADYIWRPMEIYYHRQVNDHYIVSKIEEIGNNTADLGIAHSEREALKKAYDYALESFNNLVETWKGKGFKVNSKNEVDLEKILQYKK